MPEDVVWEVLGALGICVQGVMQLRSGRRDQTPEKDRAVTSHAFQRSLNFAPSPNSVGSEWQWKRTCPRKDPCSASGASASATPSVTAVTRLVVWRVGRLTIQASAQPPKSSLNAAAAEVTTPPTTGAAGSARRLRRLLRGGHLRSL
jgi:hypothetical protein